MSELQIFSFQCIYFQFENMDVIIVTKVTKGFLLIFNSNGCKINISNVTVRFTYT